jgi:hypothetical protein
MRGLVPGLATPYPLVEILPSLLREDAFAQSICAGLDEVLAPVIATLDSLPAYLDPATVPDDMLGWLAGWMGIALDDHQSAEDQRRWVKLGVELLQRRELPVGSKQRSRRCSVPRRRSSNPVVLPGLSRPARNCRGLQSRICWCGYRWTIRPLSMCAGWTRSSR